MKSHYKEEAHTYEVTEEMHNLIPKCVCIGLPLMSSAGLGSEGGECDTSVQAAVNLGHAGTGINSSIRRNSKLD